MLEVILRNIPENTTLRLKLVNELKWTAKINTRFRNAQLNAATFFEATSYIIFLFVNSFSSSFPFFFF